MGAGTQTHLIFPRRAIPGVSWSPPLERAEAPQPTIEASREFASKLAIRKAALEANPQPPPSPESWALSSPSTSTQTSAHPSPRSEASDSPVVEESAPAGSAEPASIGSLIQKFERANQADPHACKGPSPRLTELDRQPGSNVSKDTEDSPDHKKPYRNSAKVTGPAPIMTWYRACVSAPETPPAPFLSEDEAPPASARIAAHRAPPAATSSGETAAVDLLETGDPAAAGSCKTATPAEHPRSGVEGVKTPPVRGKFNSAEPSEAIRGGTSGSDPSGSTIPANESQSSREERSTISAAVVVSPAKPASLASDGDAPKGDARKGEAGERLEAVRQLADQAARVQRRARRLVGGRARQQGVEELVKVQPGDASRKRASNVSPPPKRARRKDGQRSRTPSPEKVNQLLSDVDAVTEELQRRSAKVGAHVAFLDDLQSGIEARGPDRVAEAAARAERAIAARRAAARDSAAQEGTCSPAALQRSALDLAQLSTTALTASMCLLVSVEQGVEVSARACDAICTSVLARVPLGSVLLGRGGDAARPQPSLAVRAAE
ncbi:hypothetical protein WJX75_009159 [Coccomyxa subellipsoidea]|uniref:Uncharacterized protein n=1 Tax=Coccomyxa subellipsoidea TaxID=248742 RepID=A0ABR2Z4F8_9CHLO